MNEYGESTAPFTGCDFRRIHPYHGGSALDFLPAMRITPLPPLQCLIAFEAAVRHASFTKAAAELHLTQSAVSRQIQQLEEFLGRSLFVREHRSLRLTIAGEQYAAQVHHLLTQCAEATHDVMKPYGDLELTIACSSGVAVLWLTPRLPNFRATYPNIKLIVFDNGSTDGTMVKGVRKTLMRPSEPPFSDSMTASVPSIISSKAMWRRSGLPLSQRVTGCGQGRPEGPTQMISRKPISL